MGRGSDGSDGAAVPEDVTEPIERRARKTERPVLTGAQIVCRALEAEGVDTVFGYPGGAVIPLYDALPGAGFHHVLVRFEQWAALAADGYARATGKAGVCIATSGPGATNLVTGLANAMLDSVPIVAITGQVVQPLIGRDAFQEVDITGITLPVTKHNYLVQPHPGHRADDQGSVLPGHQRPARSGAGRHPEEALHAEARVRVPGNRVPARLPADLSAEHAAGPAGRRGDQQGAESR